MANHHKPFINGLFSSVFPGDVNQPEAIYGKCQFRQTLPPKRPGLKTATPTGRGTYSQSIGWVLLQRARAQELQVLVAEAWPQGGHANDGLMLVVAKPMPQNTKQTQIDRHRIIIPTMTEKNTYFKPSCKTLGMVYY